MGGFFCTRQNFVASPLVVPSQLARLLLHKNVKDLLANHPMLADKMLFDSSREFLLTRNVLSIGATKVKRQIEAVVEGWE